MSNKPNRLPETLNDYPPQSSRARGTLEPIPQEDARNGGRASVPRAASGGSGQIQGAGAPGVSLAGPRRTASPPPGSALLAAQSRPGRAVRTLAAGQWIRCGEMLELQQQQQPQPQRQRPERAQLWAAHGGPGAPAAVPRDPRAAAAPQPAKCLPRRRSCRCLRRHHHRCRPPRLPGCISSRFGDAWRRGGLRLGARPRPWAAAAGARAPSRRLLRPTLRLPPPLFLPPTPVLGPLLSRREPHDPALGALLLRALQTQDEPG